MDKTENLKYWHEPQKLTQHKSENAGGLSKRRNVWPTIQPQNVLDLALNVWTVINSSKTECYNTVACPTNRNNLEQRMVPVSNLRKIKCCVFCKDRM